MPIFIGDNTNPQKLWLSKSLCELEDSLIPVLNFLNSATPAQIRAWASTAPAVVTALTPGANVPVVLAGVEIFTLALGGAYTLGNPTGSPYTGQKLEILVTQGVAGTNTLAYGTAYKFGTTLPLPTITKVAGKTDRLLFEYLASTGFWYLIDLKQGY